MGIIWSKNTGKQIIRFIIVGVVNTLTYYAFYLVLLHWVGLKYLFSHVIAFILSMIGSFFMNTRFTYQTRPTLRKFFQFPLTYVVNITVTTSALYLLVTILGFDENLSPFFASLVAIPFTFLVSKRILLPESRTLEKVTEDPTEAKYEKRMSEKNEG